MNIDCVIVTYNPDIDLIKDVLKSLEFQIRNCYIINNGSSLVLFIKSNITITNLDKNYGIAYAQNMGIEIALSNKADFVLLSDQDTIYPVDFVTRMIAVYEKHDEKDKIAALVPRFYDAKKKRETQIAITRFKYIIPKDNQVYEVAHAISSGTLIPATSLISVGKMCEMFFIDWVDFEWCCRAINAGLKIISVPQVSIKHSMGDSTRKIGNRIIALRNRARYYYMIRNGIYIILYTNLLKDYEKILFIKDLFIKSMGILLIEKNALPLLVKAIGDAMRKRMYSIKEHCL